MLFRSMSLYEDECIEQYMHFDTNAMRFANMHTVTGTYLHKYGGGRTWVGTPLIVNKTIGHPMDEICNAISYDGMLKHNVSKTPIDFKEKFMLNKSHVFHVVGKQIAPKIHYVEDEGDKVVYLLSKMFNKYDSPISWRVSHQLLKCRKNYHSFLNSSFLP